MSVDYDNPLNAYLTIREVAAELGVHHATVRRLVRERRLTSGFKFVGKYYFDPKEIEDFKPTYDGRPGAHSHLSRIPMLINPAKPKRVQSRESIE